MIKALIASVSLLALASGLCWHLGSSLTKEKAYSKQLTANLATCELNRQEAVKTTLAWSVKYNDDMQAKDDEYAKQIEDMRAKQKVTCSAQFDAGYQYGLRIGATKPVRVRGEGDDFGEYWVGKTH